jgi:hypothetical protein
MISESLGSIAIETCSLLENVHIVIEVSVAATEMRHVG